MTPAEIINREAWFDRHNCRGGRDWSESRERNGSKATFF